MPKYLNVDHVVAIHDLLLKRYGGTPGIIDLGLLDSALHRPQIGYYADIIEEAAALWESLSQNHAFADGNKRVAFASTDVFLRLNGVTIFATSEQAETDIIRLYETGSFTYPNLETWLRQHTRPS